MKNRPTKLWIATLALASLSICLYSEVNQRAELDKMLDGQRQLQQIIQSTTEGITAEPGVKGSWLNKF